MGRRGTKTRATGKSATRKMVERSTTSGLMRTKYASAEYE